jgi:GWxTD domain-containing protein
MVLLLRASGACGSALQTVSSLPSALAHPAFGRLAALAAASFIMGSAVAAELRDPAPTRRLERPRFACDAGALWHGDTALVAVEVVVPYPELMFRPDGTRYKASFDLIVVLYEDKRQITGDLWTETVEVSSYADTRAEAKEYRRGVLLRAHPGNLRVEVTVSEQQSGNEGRLEQPVVVPDINKDPVVIGKVWFARCPGDSLGEVRLVPAEPIVSRRFGAAMGRICAWSHLYRPPGHEGELVSVKWKVRNDHREVVSEDRLEIMTRAGGTPLFLHIPTERFWLGGYDLVLSAEIEGKDVTRIVPFEMDETVVSLEHNPAESLQLIRFIAKGEEIAVLESAPPERRAGLWEEFWKKRDPTPETEENEFKVEFFRRVRFANENFSSLGPGWKTDRGMIYIQYGAPDLIESFPHNVDGPPYEVWSYYTLRRRFVFVDYDGFGRYELYTPFRH